MGVQKSDYLLETPRIRWYSTERSVKIHPVRTISREEGIIMKKVEPKDVNPEEALLQVRAIISAFDECYDSVPDSVPYDDIRIEVKRRMWAEIEEDIRAAVGMFHC